VVLMLLLDGEERMTSGYRYQTASNGLARFDLPWSTEGVKALVRRGVRGTAFRSGGGSDVARRGVSFMMAVVEVQLKEERFKICGLHGSSKSRKG
jgi:hypothetical protein